MNVAESVRGREKLTKKEVEDIIKENAPHLSSIDRNLRRELPSLVDYISGLARKRNCTYILSEFYPQELPTIGGERVSNFEVIYFCNQYGISMDALDPHSDTSDPGDSYIKQIPRKEFLEWVMEDGMRMIDVYQHIQAALRQEKGNGEAHRKHLETYS